MAIPDRAALQQAVRICACFNLRRAARAVTRLYDEVLAPGGLRSTQFVALVAIQAEGSPPLPRLARTLGVDRSTLTRNLQPLVRRGLIEMEVAKGGRIARAKLTTRGESALERSLPLWREAQGRFEDRVGADAWRSLLERLSSVVTSVPDA